VRRLHEDVLEIVVNQVGEKYLNVKNVRRKRVFEDISLACEDLGLPAPSYSWFCRFLKSLPKYTVKKLREGDKSAYSLAPRISADPGAANSDEPSASFLRAHIDHPQSDLETIFSETGENLGRPWLTVMIDHYSRRILGFHVSYEPPSYRAVLMTLRDCVRRYGRLPSEIVVDGGKEFRSIWFDVVCAFFRVDVKRRPARKARFGAQIERFFGSANSILLHTLSGNTQLRKNVRQMTPAVDPSKAAIWTLPALKGLLEEFLFETYETLDHTGVLEKPRNRFLRGLTISGDRPERVIVYDRKFLIATCPSTKKGTAKVQPDGVKINHFYYNAAALGRHLGESVHVRYEPYDLSKAYARVDGEWIELNCRYGDQLRGLGEAELELILDEYKALHGLVNRRRINDTTLAKFMKEVEKSEVVLRARKQAAEQHRSSPGSLDELQNSSGQSAHGTEEREGAPPPTAAADATEGYDRHDEDDFVEDEEFADLETY